MGIVSKVTRESLLRDPNHQASFVSWGRDAVANRREVIRFRRPCFDVCDSGIR